MPDAEFELLPPTVKRDGLAPPPDSSPSGPSIVGVFVVAEDAVVALQHLEEEPPFLVMLK